MERKNVVREARVFHGKDVKLGWIYDSSKMDFNPPKIDKGYNFSENRKYKLDICTKNDKVKYTNFDSHRDKPWYKDFCNIPATETIYVYGSAEIERKASGAISYEPGQGIVTSLLNKKDIVILIFLNKDLLDPFKTAQQLKCFLDYMLEGNKEAFMPDCLNDGGSTSIIYHENQRVPTNLMHALKESCRIMKTTTFDKAKSVYLMDMQLHETMLKEHLLLNDSQNRKSNVAEAKLNLVNKNEVNDTNQPSEESKSTTPSAFEYSKINQHLTTKMTEAITSGTKIDLENQNKKISNISQEQKISERQTNMYSGINTPTNVEISPGREPMHLKESKGSFNTIPDQENKFTKQEKCEPIEQHNTKDKKKETKTDTINRIPTINLDHIPAGRESIDNTNTVTNNNISTNSEQDIQNIPNSTIPKNINNSDKLLANNDTKNVSNPKNANNNTGHPTERDKAAIKFEINKNIHSEQMNHNMSEEDKSKSKQEKKNIKEKVKSNLPQNMNDSKKLLTKYPENNTSSKEISISSRKEPQELNTSKDSCSYIRSQENPTSIEQPGTKDKDIELEGKVKEVLQTKNLEHISEDRTDIHCQNVGTDTFVAINSENIMSGSHESKSLGKVNESGKTVRDDDTKNICHSKNTDQAIGHQKCISKVNDTKLNAKISEIISKSFEPKNRMSVNEAYNLSSGESDSVHNMNDKSLSTSNSQDEHYNRGNKMDKGTNLLNGNSSSTVLKSAASEANSYKEDKSQYKPPLNTSTSNVSTKASNSFKKLESKSKIVDSCGIEKHCYGSFPPDSEEKVILLLGASGSGKTTLVNFVANYFEEVKTPDEKMVLINPNLNSSKQSSTKKITSYSFSSEKEPGLVFTFIDTPGLNDSSGAEVRDHVQSLKTFLSNMNAANNKIHALGFVVQAHLVRLTSSERLVMDYVSTLFGEKVKDNIITFVTFADNQENPPVVEAIENYGLKTKHFLKFNNSILSANTYVVDDLDRVYWRKGYKSIKKGIKLVKDMPPLCVNAMKALQREVHSKTVVEGVMKDLEAEILGLFYTVQKEKSREQICKTSNLVWELATAAFYQIKQSNHSYESREDLVRKVTLKVCQKKSISSQDCLKYLTFASNRGMKPAALGIIYSLSMVYNKLKKSDTEARSHTKKAKISHSESSFVLFCHECQKEHLMERIPKNNWSWNNDREVKLKCKNCTCPGELHGITTDPNGKKSLSISELLEHARSGLANTIRSHSIPNVRITDMELLEFILEEVNDKHKSFIRELLSLIKNTV